MIDALLPTAARTGAGAATQRAQLNREDFLKILTTEISNQNPLDPMSNEDFLGQLAQLQQLETSAALEDTLSNLVKFQELGAAGSMLGRTVRAIADDGSSVTGSVERVIVSGSKVRLIVAGQPAALANVQEIVF